MNGHEKWILVADKRGGQNTKTKLARFWWFTCPACGRENTIKVAKNQPRPRYCNRDCYRISDNHLAADARAVRAYKLYYGKKEPTYQELTRTLGVTTRERVRQLVNKGRELVANGYE